MIVDIRSQHFEQLKHLTSYEQNCLNWLGGSSRFQVWLRKNWERVLRTNLQQLPWTKKVVYRTATLLFDNYNACILKQNTNTVRLCQFVFKSWSDSTRHQDELDLQFVSIYKPQIISYGTQPMVLFVGLGESFCLWIFCLLLLLVIVVVDMLLAAPSS